MVTQNTNPFVLPGFGQSGEMAQNPMLASMEMMRKAWEGLASAGGFDQAFASSGLAPEDLERRIADLRAVENWLRMNLSMLGSTIQALEVQRATVSTLQSFLASAASAGGAATHGSPSPLDVALGLHPGGEGAQTSVSGDSTGLFGARPTQRRAATGDARASGGAADDTAAQASRESAGDAQVEKNQPSADASAAPQAAPNPAEAAMHTWWDMLQTQFDNLASAATASMQGAEAMQEAAAAAQQQAVASTQAAASGAVKKTASKSAPSKTPRGAKSTAKKAAEATAADTKRAAPSKTAKKSAAKKSAAKKTSAKKAVGTRSAAARKS